MTLLQANYSSVSDVLRASNTSNSLVNVLNQIASCSQCKAVWVVLRTLQGKSVMEQRDHQRCSVHGQSHYVQNLLHSDHGWSQRSSAKLMTVYSIMAGVIELFFLVTATIGEKICFFNALTVIEFQICVFRRWYLWWPTFTLCFNPKETMAVFVANVIKGKVLVWEPSFVKKKKKWSSRETSVGTCI